MADDFWSPDALKTAPLDGFRDLLQVFAAHSSWPTLGELEHEWLVTRGINSMSGAPLRLALQVVSARSSRPRNRRDLYDVSVCNGQVPTRPNNWHDFFNVLMFAAFPCSKRALHGRHCRVLEQRVPEQVDVLPGARTREQDHLAMLDEGGVLLAVEPRNLDAITDCLELAEHERLHAAVECGQVRPWLIGHAHLEHLAMNALSPTPADLPRAKPVLLDVGVDATRSELDAALAEQLAAPTVDFLAKGWRGVSLVNLFGSGTAVVDDRGEVRPSNARLLG